MHICITWSWWVNSLWPGSAWWHQAITCINVDFKIVWFCGKQFTVHKILLCIMSLKIILLTSLPHFPGSNELSLAYQCSSIDPSHKSHDASDNILQHHFVTEMCTCVHISVTKSCIVGYGTDAFWDLWDGSIDTALPSFWWPFCSTTLVPYHFIQVTTAYGTGEIQRLWEPLLPTLSADCNGRLKQYGTWGS